MDELAEGFDTINIPVALACDGNRRKELNMIKRSKGCNWGNGAVSCSYWKGPLLRGVLLADGIPEKSDDARRCWVNFEVLMSYLRANTQFTFPSTMLWIP